MATIVFLNIPGHTTDVMTIFPPIGIMSMSAILKQYGHDVAFIDVDIDKYQPEEVCSLLKQYSPDMIGITLNVSQVYYLEEYLFPIQEKLPEAEVVLGGPYVTAVGSQILYEFQTVKYAIVHEGEYAVVDFVDYLSGRIGIDKVRNLIFRREGGIHKNKIERVGNVDSLPMSDYSLVSDNIHKYAGAYPSIGSPSVAIMCTRGCPYKCTFCSSPVTWGGKVTFRSVDSVINEILYLKETFDVKEIFFQDDTLNLRRSWFVELCDSIIAHNLHTNTYFKCPFRVNHNILDKEILQKAKEANFWMIFYGVENGNQQMLDSMNKGITIDEIKRAFRLTRECGICSYASFMIGNDGETIETVQDSIALLDEIMPDYGGFAIAAPFPGTELYNIAQKKKHIKISSFKQYRFGDCVMRTDGLSIDNIIELANNSNKHYEQLKCSFKYQNLLKKNGCYRFKRMREKGFYGEELWHTYVRRSQKKVSCVVPNSSSSSKIFLKILADYPDIVSNPVRMEIFINDSLVCTHIFSDAEWAVVSIPYDNNKKEDALLGWEVDRVWRPNDYGNTNDARELGLTIEKIWAV